MRSWTNLAAAAALLAFGHALRAETSVPPPAPAKPAAVEALRQVQTQHFPVKGDTGPTSWSSGAYNYDPAGNLIAVGNEYFYYDGENRLTLASINPGSGAQQQSYSYDPYGNMNGRQLPGQSMTPVGINGASNHLTGNSAQYDDAGNVSSWTANGDTISYAYDGINMLRQLSDTLGHNTLYLYTADDQRYWIFDLTANVSHWTVRDLKGNVLRDFGKNGATWSVGRDYFFRRNLPLASSIPSTGTVVHFSLDHLGTPRLLTDQNGGKVGFHVYWPYGDEWSGAGMQESPAVSLKFTGHERDADLTGYGDQLDYMHARYFQPGVGRFMSYDPVLDLRKTIENPQMWNRYLYVLNNPLRYTDPSGRYKCDGNSEDCDTIEKAIQRVRDAAANLPKGSEEQKRAEAVAKMYGKADQKNGVVVKVSTVQNNAVAQTGTARPFIRQVTTVTVDLGIARTNFGGHFDTELAAIMGHEMQHGIDQRAGLEKNNRDAEKAMELRAFTTQSFINQGLGVDSVYRVWTQSGGRSDTEIERNAEHATQVWCNNGGNCQP
jgi:RHS repeat-associated protein